MMRGQGQRGQGQGQWRQQRRQQRNAGGSPQRGRQRPQPQQRGSVPGLSNAMGRVQFNRGQGQPQGGFGQASPMLAAALSRYQGRPIRDMQSINFDSPWMRPVQRFRPSRPMMQRPQRPYIG